MSSVDDYDLPFNERPDLTPYLIHLTKRNTKKSALENLESILKVGVIHGTDSYVIGPRKAACFMDIPFVALKYVCSKSNAPKYEPYGIVIRKTTAYKCGARPVLYLSRNEREHLGITKDNTPEALWRVVTLEGSDEKGIWGVNWTHEREWRCPDEFDLPSTPIAALVRTSEEALMLSQKIAKKPGAYKSKPQNIFPMKVICQGLIY